MASISVEKKRARFWELVEPGIDGYAKTIDTLLSMLTEEQLADLVGSMEDDD